MYLHSFYIDKYPVDVRRYGECVAAGGCTPLTDFRFDGEIFSDNVDPPRPLMPVITATHEQAVAYCEWEGRSLASGAQWERAATGVLGERVTYPFGDTSWCDDQLYGFSTPSCGGLGAWPPRHYVDVYVESGEWQTKTANSIGVEMLYHYFEWTSDTQDAYPTDGVVRTDPVIQGAGAYELRGLTMGWLIDEFNNDIAERDNTRHWGFRTRGSIRCAHIAEQG